MSAKLGSHVVCSPKKTALHGTLELTIRAVKFKFQQVLLKTLIPTINTLKDMAVLKTDGKCAPEAKPGRLGFNPKVFFAVVFNCNQLCKKTLNSTMNIKGSARGDPWV